MKIDFTPDSKMLIPQRNQFNLGDLTGSSGQVVVKTLVLSHLTMQVSCDKDLPNDGYKVFHLQGKRTDETYEQETGAGERHRKCQNRC